MENLILDIPESSSANVLCLGAHCDDIEIGCGGTILTILQNRPSTTVDWVIFCTDEVRAKEAQNSAKALAADTDNIRLHLLNFCDGYLPYEAAAAKKAMKALSGDLHPDLVFTHYRKDAHQDHRTVSEITWNLFRDHLILEYEIPKFDGDLGTPNTYVSLDEIIVKRKIEVILENFPSQGEKHWFDEEAFRSILRLRGIESGRRNRYAEAFYCRKQVISLR